MIRNRVQVTYIIIVVITNVLDAGTNVTIQRKFAKVLVVVQHQVAIDLTSVLVSETILTLRTCEDSVGRSAILCLILSCGIVQLCTTADGETLHNLVCSASAEHVTVLVIDEHVAIDLPVWVLHRDTLVAPWPVLSLEVTFLVIHFI